MADLDFEWDRRKARGNLKKHGVSFEEAQSVFYDEEALYQEDDEHSDEEDRFVLLGLSSVLRLLVVVHCFRGADDVIRIISARRATPSEAGQYKARGKP